MISSIIEGKPYRFPLNKKLDQFAEFFLWNILEMQSFKFKKKYEVNYDSKKELF